GASSFLSSARPAAQQASPSPSASGKSLPPLRRITSPPKKTSPETSRCSRTSERSWRTASRPRQRRADATSSFDSLTGPPGASSKKALTKNEGRDKKSSRTSAACPFNPQNHPNTIPRQNSSAAAAPVRNTTQPAERGVGTPRYRP